MDEKIKSGEHRGFFSRLYTGVTHPVTSLIFGVLLPAATVFLESGEHICAEMFWDPMPTEFQQIMLVAVVACNLIAWLCCLKGWGVAKKTPRVMCGFSFGVSVVYAVLFLPMALFGTLFACLAFWYFGVGLIGLLPTAPLFATISAMGFRRGLDRRAEERGLGKVKGFAWGVALAAFAWLLPMVEYGVTAYAIKSAVSDDPVASARGVRILRAMPGDTSERIIRSSVRQNAPWMFRPAGLFVGDYSINRDQRNAILYRVTGENPEQLDWYGTTRRSLRWDDFFAGEKVGGELEGLSLKGSSYETTMDVVGGVGYAEWTLVFANSIEWRDQEARARIALPPGAVVSRLTLWINGEEHEAAFGTRGQVRRAYESVVRRNRDPVLVNVCGPDQVQMQCFPVPRKGEMKVRLGITVPLAVSEDGKSARLAPPVLLARNFSVPGNLLGLPGDEVTALEKPPASVAVYADDAFEPLKGFAIVQSAKQAIGWKPQRVAVVVDTSAGMEQFIDKVSAALAELPADVAAELWIVDDLPPNAPAAVSPANDAARQAKFKDALDSVSCAGGRSNLETLVAAVDELRKSAERSALVWIHGAQPIVPQTAEVLSSKLTKAPQVRMVLCQVEPGTCEITASLASLPTIDSCTASALTDGISAALKESFSRWDKENWKSSRTKVPRAEVPKGAAAASRHVGRIWASEETARTYRVGDPVSLEKAQKIALPWQIVTPVTGAVVLETEQQYKDNKLKPAESDSVPTTTPSSVPTVPEPGTVGCLLLATLVLAWTVLRMRKARG